MNKESKEHQPYFANCFTWRKKWKLAKNTGQCLPGLTSLRARNQRAWFHLFCYIERGKKSYYKVSQRFISCYSTYIHYWNLFNNTKKNKTRRRNVNKKIVCHAYLYCVLILQFVMTDSHSKVLADMLESHSVHDFCLVGPKVRKMNNLKFIYFC